MMGFCMYSKNCDCLTFKKVIKFYLYSVNVKKGLHLRSIVQCSVT